MRIFNFHVSNYNNINQNVLVNCWEPWTVMVTLFFSFPKDVDKTYCMMSFHAVYCLKQTTKGLVVTNILLC